MTRFIFLLRLIGEPETETKMKQQRISGKEAARVAEDMAKPGRRRAGGGRRGREPGGGDQPKSQDQPHAVWSADKERQPLPVSGDAERPLPDARRDVPGRPEG
jgi:hypothetical protein